MNYLKKSRLYPDGLPAVGLLFLRIFVGYAMASHGLGKIAAPFSWMGEKATTPGFLQALAAVSEFFGGLAIIFGAFFPLACLGVMCTMFVATMGNLNKGQALIGGGGESTELSALFFVIALALFMTGPGVLSFDYALFGRKKPVATT